MTFFTYFFIAQSPSPTSDRTVNCSTVHCKNTSVTVTPNWWKIRYPYIMEFPEIGSCQSYVCMHESHEQMGFTTTGVYGVS